jgi:fumarylacetoacetate (FAA) hydrolase family protein
MNRKIVYDVLTERRLVLQVIGCAYTFKVSQAVRDSFSKERADHSSHKGRNAFSYFKKVEKPEDIVGNEGTLQLRKHPITGENVEHWPEPELAILLGERHKIVTYGLGNDFTAKGLEFEQAGKNYDPTHYGKCWKGSCSISNIFLELKDIGEIGDLEIGLRIIRSESLVYDHCYSTSQRTRDFEELPELVLERLSSFKEALPESKKITVDSNGFLPQGTVILAGTGLIVPKHLYSEDGDVVVVYSPGLGELTNTIRRMR